MNTKLLLAAALAISAIASPANADTGHNQMSVEYSDLNLSGEAGQSTFDSRLDRAIRKVCQPGFTRSVREAERTRACIAEKRAELAPLRNAVIAEAKLFLTTNTLAHNPR